MIEFKKAHEQFIEDLKGKNRSNATILAYGKDIEQLVDFLMELNKETSSHVQKEDLLAFISKLERKNYTKKSISRKINSTKTFFRFLEINEYIILDFQDINIFFFFCADHEKRFFASEHAMA